MTATANPAELSDSTEFDYTIVYDTICGWCHGAAQDLEAMVDSGARIQILHRYLFQGDIAPQLADGYASFMTKADAQIAELTGAAISDVYARKVRSSATEQLESGFTGARRPRPITRANVRCTIATAASTSKRGSLVGSMPRSSTQTSRPFLRRSEDPVHVVRAIEVVRLRGRSKEGFR